MAEQRVVKIHNIEKGTLLNTTALISTKLAAIQNNLIPTKDHPFDHYLIQATYKDKKFAELNYTGPNAIYTEYCTPDNKHRLTDFFNLCNEGGGTKFIQFVEDEVFKGISVGSFNDDQYTYTMDPGRVGNHLSRKLHRTLSRETIQFKESTAHKFIRNTWKTLLKGL